MAFFKTKIGIRNALQVSTCTEKYRVATVREKCLENEIFSRSGKNVWKMKFFPGQGKVREFCGWLGKFLERTWKVREKSGNLKRDSYGSLQKIIYSAQKGKGYTFS